MSTFNLFLYGPLGPEGVPHEVLSICERVDTGVVGGLLYQINNTFPVLLQYGDTPVHGEVWRCPVESLADLDAHAKVDDGVLRRIGHEVASAQGDRTPCWLYVAGPSLRRKLIPANRLTVHAG